MLPTDGAPALPRLNIERIRSGTAALRLTATTESFGSLGCAPFFTGQVPRKPGA